jgi:hypothetical protein
MLARKVWLVLAAGCLIPLAIGSAAVATHSRPGSATPTRVPLVPAYKRCVTPNQTHVAPLTLPSCDPPALASDILTLGTLGEGGGPFPTSAALRAFCYPPETVPPCTPGDGQDEEDIAMDVFVNDVRCRVAAPGSGCSAAGADYTGGLLVRVRLRITDHAGGSMESGATTCANSTGGPPCRPVTLVDTNLDVPTNGIADASPCQATPGSPGASCSFSTLVDVQIPGAIKEGQSSIHEMPRIQLLDLGADGSLGVACPPVCGTGDENTFVDEGVFAP